MELYKLKYIDIKFELKNEDKTYLLALLWLFFEYVRPQTLYPVIDVVPYGKIIIAVWLFVYFFQKERKRFENSTDSYVSLFALIIVISSFVGISFSSSFEYWHLFISWILIYYLVTHIVNTERRYLLFVLLFLLCSFKMAQFSLRGWINGGLGYSSHGFGGGPGWFANSGEFGIQMCVYFPISFYFYITLKEYWPKWKRLAFALFPITGLTGMLSSSNRGTIVGGAVVIIWMFLKSRYKFKALCALVLIGLLAFQFVPEVQKKRFETVGEDLTSISRIENWKKGLKMAEMYPVFGVGYKNWQVADLQLFEGNGLLSHNIFIECVSELGYSGLTVFICLIMLNLMNNASTRKLVRVNGSIENKFIYNMAHALDAALIGFLVSGFFVTVLFYPYFWINLSMTIALNNVAKSMQFKKAS